MDRSPNSSKAKRGGAVAAHASDTAPDDGGTGKKTIDTMSRDQPSHHQHHQHHQLSQSDDSDATVAVSPSSSSSWSRRLLLGMTSDPRKLRHRLDHRQHPATDAAAAVPATTTAASAEPTNHNMKGRLSLMDVALFVTYFCNMTVLTLTVVTVPAAAADHFAHPSDAAAFVAGVAGMAPLGGGMGKLVNGFVCQRLGGRQASFLYLLGMSALGLAMSFNKSIGSVGWFLLFLDFLSSIQWTCICNVLDQHYRYKPDLMARGVALLGLSSTAGALAAKTVGAGLLRATDWRTVCRFGSVVALVGAMAMYGGVKAPLRPGRQQQQHRSEATASPSSHDHPDTSKSWSPLAILGSILGAPVFWPLGMAISVGFLARGSDRLVGAFLLQSTSLPSHIATGLTSSLTIGFVLGLFQGSIFSKLHSVESQMTMIKRNYALSVLCILGLALCGVDRVKGLINNSHVEAAVITVLSGVMAATVSFQHYQFPTLASSTVFPENSSVALSLLDAAGCLVAAQVLAANSIILGRFGWSFSWAFLAAIFALGGGTMTRSIRPVLVQARKNHRRLAMQDAEAQ